LLHYIKGLVRCHQEYANSIWNPHRQGLIKALEKVQMRGTKLVLTVKHLTYIERLLRLKLPTLKYRRSRGDRPMIEAATEAPAHIYVASNELHSPGPSLGFLMGYSLLLVVIIIIIISTIVKFLCSWYSMLSLVILSVQHTCSNLR